MYHLAWTVRFISGGMLTDLEAEGRASCFESGVTTGVIGRRPSLDLLKDATDF